MNTNTPVQNVWKFSRALRDVGVAYENYKIERIRAERAARVAVKKPRGRKTQDALA